MGRQPCLFFLRSRAPGTDIAAAVLLLSLLFVVPAGSAQTYTYSVLYNFSGLAGFNPSSAVVLGSSGNLYGATQSGGALGLGAVFTLRASGEEEVLYSFDGAGGSAGVGDICPDADGDIFGTTFGGGTADSGTVFRYNVHRRQYTMMYSFLGGTDGYCPSGGVIRDAAGNLYGTTYQGGDPICSADQSCGTVFKLDTVGRKSILHNFVTASGTFPQGGLLRDADGNLYGTAANGGAHGAGVIYKIDPADAYRVVYSFRGKPDGEAPIGRLIRDNSHYLYGTTNAGGSLGWERSSGWTGARVRRRCCTALPGAPTANTRSRGWFGTRTATCLAVLTREGT